MNISSVGSSVQYAVAGADSSAGAAVMGKVLDQEKAQAQDTVELIASAGAQPPEGHTLSVYA
jgi:hypothetical protein